MNPIGEYVLQPAIAYKVPKKFSQPAPVAFDPNILAGKQAPSIPTKFQSHGYETKPDGRLELQEPLNPGYSGKRYDAVGPADYNPKVDVKFKAAPKINFGKVP